MNLRRSHQLGDTHEIEDVARALLSSQQFQLSEGDQNRFLRRILEVEIKALDDLTAGDASRFDGIQRQAEEPAAQPLTPSSPGELMSSAVEKFLTDKARENDWPAKTVLRKRGELREFQEICGDKPINGYSQQDGVRFKDTEMSLPANRQRPPFKGRSLAECARLAQEIKATGEKIDLLNPITIADKLSTIGVFFAWARARDGSVVDPVAGLGIKRSKRRQGKKRHPWTIDELNKMFAAPIYTGCLSERRWAQPGKLILDRSAIYWVPLIALFRTQAKSTPLGTPGARITNPDHIASATTPVERLAGCVLKIGIAERSELVIGPHATLMW